MSIRSYRGLGLVPFTGNAPSPSQALRSRIAEAQASNDWGTLTGIGPFVGRCSPIAILRILDAADSAGMDPVSYLNSVATGEAAGYYQVCMAALLANGFGMPAGQEIVSEFCVPPMVRQPGGLCVMPSTNGGKGGAGQGGTGGSGVGPVSGGLGPGSGASSGQWISGISNTAAIIVGVVVLGLGAVMMGGKH